MKNIRICIALLINFTSYINPIDPISASIGATGLAGLALISARYVIQVPWAHITLPWSSNIKATNFHFEQTNQSFYLLQKKVSEHSNPSQNVLYFFLPGFGDHPLAVGTVNHSPLMPTTHFYSVLYEEAATKFVLNTSMGGRSEILAALTSLRHILQNDILSLAEKNGNFSQHIAGKDRYTSIAYMGESRGGGLLINILAILAQPHHVLLEEAGIDENLRKKIIEMSKSGCAVLRVPLIDFQDATEFMLGAQSTENAIARTFIRYSAQLTKKLIVPILTGFRYSSSALPPIDMVKYLKDLQIPLLCCFASHDFILGKKLNKKFMEELKKYNGAATYQYTFVGDHIMTADDEYQALLPYFFRNKKMIPVNPTIYNKAEQPIFIRMNKDNTPTSIFHKNSLTRKK